MSVILKSAGESFYVDGGDTISVSEEVFSELSGYGKNLHEQKDLIEFILDDDAYDYAKDSKGRPSSECFTKSCGTYLFHGEDDHGTHIAVRCGNDVTFLDLINLPEDMIEY